MKNHKMRLLFGMLLLFTITGCENERADPSLSITTPHDPIAKGSELFDLLETVTTSGDHPVENTVCIDFVYTFKIFVFDGDGIQINEVIMHGDNQFSSLLSALPAGYSISLSYPIQTSLPDGTVFSVNNNTELKLALDSCSRADIISHCSGLFGSPQGSCVWEVPYIPGENNDYAGAVFTADATGTIHLYHHNTVYQGTWIFLFVNDELYLNINLTGTDATVLAWNYNFKVTVSTGDVFELQTPTFTRKLVKDCSDTSVYTIGQTGQVVEL